MIDELLARYPLVSDQVTKGELRVLLGQLQSVIEQDISGAVVELGCYTGTTSLFIQRLLRQAPAPRPFHVYDSFAGLPAKGLLDASPAGEQFTGGALLASKAIFMKHFKQAGLPLPVIHKAWFAELESADLPPQIAWAFLDGDFYDSISRSLSLVWPRLAPGAKVAVDDYQSEALPGVKKAVDHWLAMHPARLQVTASLALLDPCR